jgi:hypothetical protein
LVFHDIFFKWFFLIYDLISSIYAVAILDTLYYLHPASKEL